MRTLIVIGAVAMLLSLLGGEASAQGGNASAPCDKATGPTPQCLGYNPFFIPPGSNQPVGFPASEPGTPEYYEEARALRRRALGQRP